MSFVLFVVKTCLDWIKSAGLEPSQYLESPQGGGIVGEKANFKEMAEREGFEPPEPRGSTVFKTVAIDHSATSPH